jgi:hypothetical protein
VQNVEEKEKEYEDEELLEEIVDAYMRLIL